MGRNVGLHRKPHVYNTNVRTAFLYDWDVGLDVEKLSDFDHHCTQHILHGHVVQRFSNVEIRERLYRADRAQPIEAIVAERCLPWLGHKLHEGVIGKHYTQAWARHLLWFFTILVISIITAAPTGQCTICKLVVNAHIVRFLVGGWPQATLVHGGGMRDLWASHNQDSHHHFLVGCH